MKTKTSNYNKEEIYNSESLEYIKSIDNYLQKFEKLLGDKKHHSFKVKLFLPLFSIYDKEGKNSLKDLGMILEGLYDIFDYRQKNGKEVSKNYIRKIGRYIVNYFEKGGDAESFYRTIEREINPSKAEEEIKKYFEWKRDLEELMTNGINGGLYNQKRTWTNEMRDDNTKDAGTLENQEHPNLEFLIKKLTNGNY